MKGIGYVQSINSLHTYNPSAKARAPRESAGEMTVTTAEIVVHDQHRQIGVAIRAANVTTALAAPATNGTVIDLDRDLHRGGGIDHDHPLAHVHLPLSCEAYQLII